MSSSTHEVMAEIASTEATQILEVLGVFVEGTGHRVDKSDFKDFSPPERFADGLVTFGTPPTLWVIFEAQLHVDWRKPSAWFGYVGYAFRKYKVPGFLVVLTNKKSVERWASKPIEAFVGQRLSILVLGPSTFPTSFESGLVQRVPSLGVLCALIHGSTPEAEEHYFDTLSAVDEARQRDALDEETASLYIDMVLAKASKTWRKLMEEKVSTGPYLSDFMNRLYQRSLDERERGREEGREEGAENALRRAIRQVVALRGFELTEASNELLDSCHDLEMLSRWHAQSLSAACADDVFVTA